MSRTRATTTGTSDTSHSTAHRDAHTPGGADALWAGDGELARSLAVEAGEVLMQIRRGGFTGDGLKAAGDAGSQAVLARRLDDDRPDDAVLSEEAPDDPARLTASRVWIIDPLDGTREFSEPGRIDWAVHVALWAGGDLVAGAVAMPADGICYCTASPPEPPVREPGPLRLAVSRTRPPAFVADSPPDWAPSWCRWARPGSSVPRSGAVRPTPTSTPAVSSSGTRRRRWPWPGPLVCTPAGSMDRPWSTTKPTRDCPIWWCVVPNWPTRL